MSQVDTIMDLEPLFDKILEKYPDKICVDASQGWLVSYATAGVFDRIEKYSTVGINVDDPNAKVTTQYLSEFGQEIFKLAERWYEACLLYTSADRPGGARGGGNSHFGFRLGADEIYGKPSAEHDIF